MPWFKVDDTFAMHEKVMAAGNAAVGLWTRSGAWSMQQLTDGFVPNHVVRALGTPKERRTLVEVSLWVEAEGGVRFLNWDERQPTKEQVENARTAAAERQRHARERAKSRRDSQRDDTCDFAGSHGPPDPTRPDPTHNNTDAYASVPAADALRVVEPNRFDEWWETYGNKVGRKKCETAYRNALKKPGVTPDRLIATAAAYVLWCRNTDTFIKNPLTWLHGEHWRDERKDIQPPRTRVQEHLALVQQLAAEEGQPTISEIGQSR
jgi:hypothetical protein